MIGVFVALEMAAVLMGGFRVSEEPQSAVILGQAGVELSNTRELGKVLYSQYVYPLEIAAAILLVAMIAAIALTLRQRKDSKQLSPSVQVRVKAKDRMIVLKMASTKVAVLDDASGACECGEKRMTLTLGHFLSLGAMLFALAVIGIFLNRKNLIVLLMAIELMLLAVNTNFVAFSYYLGDMHGQILCFLS